MNKIKISFFVEIDDSYLFEEADRKAFIEDLKRIVDHHIDQLVDISSWPEIKSIYDAKVEQL